VPLITDGKARGFLGFDALENEIRWNQDIIALLRIAGATLMNVVERKRDEVLIQNQALQDPLTSLPNRRLFMEKLEQTFQECRRHGTRAAILFVDVDYFKNVNDSLGHSAGDSLLKQIAQRLQSGLTGVEIACRLGGDEFIILLAEVGRDSKDLEQCTISRAQHIHNDLSLPYEINGQALNITVSMGVELFPSGNSTPENIISNADAAMYKAKDSGRNIVQFFQQDIHRHARSRSQLHKDLRDALYRNEFELYAQPQVNSHGDVVTDKLLVHWNNGTQGIVESTNFNSLAEDTGLNSDIDEWAINNACRLIKHQKNMDHRKNISYAINVSTTQFHKRKFTDRVADALNGSGLNGGFLELEVTGAVFNENQDSVVETMRYLKNLGVRIVLDDFGVGHFSLACLKHLPIDKIKIDKSFVRSVNQSARDAAIVDTIIDIAQRFRLEVVADGVENREQFEYLQAQGVGLFQGQHFGHPRPLALN
jgi:diguanylate cyclase (GGDEF)-like protein